jgi:hypothetical protein
MRRALANAALVAFALPAIAQRDSRRARPSYIARTLHASVASSHRVPEARLRKKCPRVTQCKCPRPSHDASQPRSLRTCSTASGREGRCLPATCTTAAREVTSRMRGTLTMSTDATGECGESEACGGVRQPQTMRRCRAGGPSGRGGRGKTFSSQKPEARSWRRAEDLSGPASLDDWRGTAGLISKANAFMSLVLRNESTAGSQSAALRRGLGEVQRPLRPRRRV